ncbi:MAG TPA: acyl-CoA dehydrogenase family protein [Dehalococcoidia bacterium]|nr:acyl-CoA dehydrogenase family protein [Dehalococcoidia bacterium]
MRLSDSPEEAAWRQTVRDFLEKELPPELRQQAVAARRGGQNPQFEGEESGEIRGRPGTLQGGEGYQRQTGPMAVWREKLRANGWIVPSWPKEYGGAEMTPMQQFILNEEFAKARAPRIGVPLAGPTIVVHGTEEQKKEFLPPMLTGEQSWCQGFSEPGSGSDLASLQTRAVRDGDDFVINGSKIWTSGAHRANMMFMLARTDPDAPKHRGITYFILDMRTPGITIQPLVQMSGAAGFNQVFFDNVRVPAKNVIGEVNRGWYVATTTLDYERSGIGSAIGTTQRVESIIEWAKENVEAGHSMLKRNPLVRLELVDRLIEAEVALMLSYRVAHMQNIGMIPNHEASMCKMYSTELNQRIARTTMKMIGLYGMAWDSNSPHSPSRGQWTRGYVASVSSTIAGGTSEIQRNIIAQRGLGLPRD